MRCRAPAGTKQACPARKVNEPSSVATLTEPPAVQSTVVGPTSRRCNARPGPTSEVSSSNSVAGVAYVPGWPSPPLAARTIGGARASKRTVASNSRASTCLGVSPARSTLSELAMISTPLPRRYACGTPAGRKRPSPRSSLMSDKRNVNSRPRSGTPSPESSRWATRAQYRGSSWGRPVSRSSSLRRRSKRRSAGSRRARGSEK